MQTSTVLWFSLVLIMLLLEVHAHKHKCSHSKKGHDYPPDVPHQVLDASFLDNYDEIMIIGDVHACLEELKLLLDKSNTTGDNVLKILAGDLTRKGPDSIGVIRFIKDYPSIIAVRGNNDQKVLRRYLKHETKPDYEYKESDKFIKNMTIDDLSYLAKLPYTLSLPSLNAIIVHGGVIPGVPLEDHEPYDLMNMRNLVKDKNCPGGYRPYNGEKKGTRWAPLWNGPEIIYFGHDHPRNMQITPYAVGVDTSCVYGRYLTGIFIKGPRKNQLVQQKAFKQYFSH